MGEKEIVFEDYDEDWLWEEIPDDGDADGCDGADRTWS